MFGLIVVGLVIGFFCGFLIRDSFYENLYKAQQERAYYWFDKYQKQINPDWKPLSEGFDEHHEWNPPEDLQH